MVVTVWGSCCKELQSLCLMLVWMGISYSYSVHLLQLHLDWFIILVVNSSG